MSEAEALEALRGFDTPTLCNALERVMPERRGFGFTTTPLVCVHPGMEPIVGHARTARIRAAQPSGRSRDAEREVEIAYYRYMGELPHPSVTVIEDLDPSPGTGAWWGEVHTHVHRGLGSLGVVTNGSVRDLDQVAAGFQILAGGVGPSHAHVHVVDFGVPVTVAGMAVEHGDLVHADRHGALVVPASAAAALPEAARAVVKGERVLIEASREAGFDAETLAKLLGGTHSS